MGTVIRYRIRCRTPRQYGPYTDRIIQPGKSKIDSTKLSSDYPSLYSILQKVSEEFEIHPADMLNYLKEKKYGNNYFHLNVDITRYANEHTNYDLDQF